MNANELLTQLENEAKKFEGEYISQDFQGKKLITVECMWLEGSFSYTVQGGSYGNNRDKVISAIKVRAGIR
jgi:hypothetical protein